MGLIEQMSKYQTECQCSVIRTVQENKTEKKLAVMRPSVEIFPDHVAITGYYADVAIVLSNREQKIRGTVHRTKFPQNIHLFDNRVILRHFFPLLRFVSVSI